jgi:hypothetical protein
MTVKIQRLDEVADFLSCLADIDDIFFTSSARRDFSRPEEKQAFREMSLGRYIERHRSSFFVALDADGRAVGYLAGCLENPITLSQFNDVAYFRSIEDICRDYPAHLHVNVAELYSQSWIGNCTSWAIRRVGEATLGQGNPRRHIEHRSKYSILPKVRLHPVTHVSLDSGISVCMGRKL